MRTSNAIPPILFVAALGAQACLGSPKLDEGRPDSREIAPKGVIRGTVTYTGARPCSRDGHVVGDLVILVFDRRNPPPPTGLANTAVNFGVITGDTLFANEQVNTNHDLYCPKDHGFTQTITAGAPFAISPMDPGSYEIQAFYDYYGDFLPTFKIRNLPMAGDVAGGYLDAADAVLHASDPNYAPKFLPIDIGIRQPLAAGPDGGPPDPNAVPDFTMPAEGFLADNIAINVGLTLPLPRPVFYLQNPGADPADPLARPDFTDSSDKPGDPKNPHPGATVTPRSQETDPNYMPVVTMTSDWQVEAQPTIPIQSNVDEQQSTFVKVSIKAGLPTSELALSRKTGNVWDFQISDPPSLFIWDSGQSIPETADRGSSGKVSQMWPLFVFAKLQDEPAGGAPHLTNPQGLLAQGQNLVDPIVIIQGLTLFNDSLFATAGLIGATPKTPADPASKTDHVSVLVRPSVICFDPKNIQQGGLLVTPHQKGPVPGSGGADSADIINPQSVIKAANAQHKLIRDYRFACMPKGRFGVNAVLPTGQAWTVPNEAGSCAAGEGPNNFSSTPPSCSGKQRDILYSQGNRAVVEIIDAKDTKYCIDHPVPAECCPGGNVDAATGQCAAK